MEGWCLSFDVRQSSKLFAKQPSRIADATRCDHSSCPPFLPCRSTTIA